MARTKRTELPTEYSIGFLSNMDKRTELYERLASTYASIVDDLGGYDSIATTKLALIERFVWLQEILRTLELDMMQSEDAKRTSDILSKWTQACNALQGIARAVGMEIQTAKASVTLEAHLKSNGSNKGRIPAR